MAKSKSKGEPRSSAEMTVAQAKKISQVESASEGKGKKSSGKKGKKSSAKKGK